MRSGRLIDSMANHGDSLFPFGVGIIAAAGTGIDSTIQRTDRVHQVNCATIPGDSSGCFPSIAVKSLPTSPLSPVDVAARVHPTRLCDQKGFHVHW